MKWPRLSYPPPVKPAPKVVKEVETFEIVNLKVPSIIPRERTPLPKLVDSIKLTPWPMMTEREYQGRDPKLRTKAVRHYKTEATEKLVLGFLRWLKMKQGSNGLWEDDAGITSIAILCYLAHGEIPGQSDEFGKTVEKALKALIADQLKSEKEAWEYDQTRADLKNAPDRFSGLKGHAFRRSHVGYFKSRNITNYTQLVATYALSEAYAMMRVPDLKLAAERAIKPIVDGQNASGGWAYNLDSRCSVTDSSYVSWAVQALKAARLANIGDENLKREIITSLKKASRGIKECFHADGRQAGAFGYLDKKTDPKEFDKYLGLTAPCVLILQMLGEGNSDLCKKALKYMETWGPTFKTTEEPPKKEKAPAIGKSSQYYCYYLSQVRFNQRKYNRSVWKRWDDVQKRLYSAAAISIPAAKSGYVDHNGDPQYITYWPVQNSSANFKEEFHSMSDRVRLEKDRGTKNGRRLGYKIDDLINRDVCTLAGWHSGKNPAMKGMILGNCLTALQLMVYYRNRSLEKDSLTRMHERMRVKMRDKREVTIEGIDDI